MVEATEGITNTKGELPMKTTYARNLAEKIATGMAVDEAYAETPRRWIWHESDFTAYDYKKIHEYVNKLLSLFADNVGGKWEPILNGIKEISPNYFMGFKMQDYTIDKLNKYGYNVTI